LECPIVQITDGEFTPSGYLDEKTPPATAVTRDYDTIEQHTSMSFSSVWVAPRGSIG
jgi:hypothetical protein